MFWNKKETTKSKLVKMLYDAFDKYFDEKIESEYLKLVERKKDLLIKEETLLIEESRLKVANASAQNELKGNQQRNDYECKWHQEMEAKRLEMSSLDCEIKSKKEILKSLEEPFGIVVKEKDKVIRGLQDTVKQLTEVLKINVVSISNKEVK